MNKPKVVILGSGGMLGSMVLDYFARTGEYKLAATHRDKREAARLKRQYPSVERHKLDAEKEDIGDLLLAILKGADWAINAIGIIKPHIHHDNPKETERAIRVNSLFPHLLAKAAQQTDTKIIQISTDSLYSGQKGSYVETDDHDALDVYGKTKSLGQTYHKNIYHIRSSIIGPELKVHMSLLDWFLSQPKGAVLSGFTNHKWNGTTTLHFARICQGIIKQNISLPHVQHVIPSNVINKADLLKCFAKEFDRQDITIEDVEAETFIDRTLSTNNEKLNQKIWQAAGYDNPPSIQEMVRELAQYKFPQKELGT